MIGNSAITRMGIAAVLASGVGGGATTAIPGLEHWPTGSVALTVAIITVAAGLVKKLLTAAIFAVALTVAAIVVAAATGGHMQSTLDLGTIFDRFSGTADR